MTKNWDAEVEHLRKQIDELRKSLELDVESTERQSQDLNQASEQLVELVAAGSQQNSAIIQLPRILQSLMSSREIGAVILGTDGAFLLFNPPVQRMLGISEIGSFKPRASFFAADCVTPIPAEDLPWERCIRGEDCPPTRICVRHADTRGVRIIDVSATPLSNPSGMTGGAITFLVDVTEHVQAETSINTWCRSLEKQLTNVEKARVGLGQLSEMLGSRSWEVTQPAVSEVPSEAPVVESVEDLFANKRVLVVDDIPVNQKLLLMQLKKMGLQTATANNGLEAVKAVASESFDLVFMDCDMPIMNGYEASLEIRKQELETGRHIPIVAMTSYDREGDREKCLASGMDEYLPKGIGKTKIREVIECFFGRRKVANPVMSGGASALQEFDPSATKLDLPALQESFGVDEANKIVELFFGSASTLLNCLEFAIEDKDVKSVNHFAYSLKGPCASLGLQSMSTLAARITAASEADRWDEANSDYKIMRSIYASLKAARPDRNQFALSWESRA